MKSKLKINGNAVPQLKAVPETIEVKPKTRYSDSELEEFKSIILEKLKSATNELTTLLPSLQDHNDGSNRIGEGSAQSSDKEVTAALARNQQNFINQLNAALVRIKNKTYGVCVKTGQLIPKERLRAVPHTTKSMQAKLAA